MNTKAEFCDACGCEIKPEGTWVFPTLPVDVGSATGGESAALCIDCLVPLIDNMAELIPMIDKLCERIEVLQDELEKKNFPVGEPSKKRQSRKNGN